MLGGGPTIYARDFGSSTVGGFMFALKGGVLVDRAEISLEFSPVTFLPYAGTGAGPCLSSMSTLDTIFRSPAPYRGRCGPASGWRRSISVSMMRSFRRDWI